MRPNRARSLKKAGQPALGTWISAACPLALPSDLRFAQGGARLPGGRQGVVSRAGACTSPDGQGYNRPPEEKSEK